VPLCDNAALVDLLVTLELGDEIPEALYIAVAYIIAFAYQLEGKVPDAWQN
jgi:flagellar biosynthesis protein